MNLYSHRDANIWKTWLLMGFFLALISAVGWGLSYYFNDGAILYIAFAIALLTNFFSYWFSDKIVLKLHKAKPVTRQDFFDLWNVTENLSVTAGLPMPKLYVIADEAPNAFATGRDKNHSVVCVTTGLLRLLDKNELEGVIAHELSHIGNYDMLLSTVAVVLAGFIALVADFFLRSGFRSDEDNRQRGGAVALIGIILAILVPLAATLIRLAISRKREFLADASGALLTRYPEGLANALRKISSAGQPLRTANNATAHLFIANPFGVFRTSSLHKLFLTHPPTEERIRALIEDNDIPHSGRK